MENLRENARKVCKSLRSTKLCRKFAPDKETKTPNAMNTKEKTWTVQPKIHNGRYGKNVYNNHAYAEFVKETLCKDTGFEWVIIESN